MLTNMTSSGTEVPELFEFLSQQFTTKTLGTAGEPSEPSAFDELLAGFKF